MDDDLTRLAIDARAGDRLALHTLVRATHPHVWRYCAALVDVDAADDLAQETFARAFGSLRRYRGDAPVRLWLLAIARRVCADEVRRRGSRRRRRERAPLGPDPAATTPDRAEAQALRSLVDALPDDRRQAFELTQLAGLTYAETAAQLGVPIGTVRSRVARARGELVAALAAAESSPTP